MSVSEDHDCSWDISFITEAKLSSSCCRSSSLLWWMFDDVETAAIMEVAAMAATRVALANLIVYILCCRRYYVPYILLFSLLVNSIAAFLLIALSLQLSRKVRDGTTRVIMKTFVRVWQISPLSSLRYSIDNLNGCRN